MRRAVGSGRVDPENRSVLGITYAKNDIRLIGDLYLPLEGYPPFPGCVVIHGGGFWGGTREWMTGLSMKIATIGLVAFNIDYRTSPPYEKSAAVEDAEAAVAWLDSQPFVLDGRVGAFGTSAGASIVDLLAASGGISAGVAWSGGGEVAATEVTSQSSPTYLAHCVDDTEVPVEGSEAMDAALAAAGVDRVFDREPGALHGIEMQQFPEVQAHTARWMTTYF